MANGNSYDRQSWSFKAPWKSKIISSISGRSMASMGGGRSETTPAFSRKNNEMDTFRAGLGVYRTSKGGAANRVGGLGPRTLHTPHAK